MAIHWPTPDLKGRTFKLCVLTRWDFNFCVRSSPLRGGAEDMKSRIVMFKEEWKIAWATKEALYQLISVNSHTLNLSSVSSPLNKSFVSYSVFCHVCSTSLVLVCVRPHEFTFTWWGFGGLCQRHKPTELVHSFLFCSCVRFCLYGPFNCILFHKVSRQLSVFSLCSSGLLSALIGPFNYISVYESLFQPWYNPLWLTGLKAPTN